MNVTWRELILDALAEHGETFEDVVANTMNDADMDKGFDNSSAEGCPFTLWTNNRVYFPTEYEGAVGVESVSRHPDGKPTHHV